jgi:glutamate racemase
MQCNCMFYPAISRSFVTSLPQHVKVMSKKRSTNKAIGLYIDNDNNNKDDSYQNRKNTKFGSHKHNMDANKEYFMYSILHGLHHH